MKAFISRSEVEVYIYSSTFVSTPHLILKEFVIWLCEQVDEPNGEEKIPRIIFYLKWKK